jgi:signal transduction histidine kinase
MSGFLELLKDNPEITGDEQRKYLQIAYGESQKMGGMIAQLFELSKLESDNIDLKKVSFPLHELISDVLQKYALTLKAKSIELKVDISPDPGLVLGDIRYIERIFQNLLDNAIKHAYENGFIKITIQGDTEQVLVKVCNLGDPIPPEELPHIFDRYYKISDNQKAGAGLGLAIAKKLCELHGGTIAADVNNQIVSFWFTLPRYKE